MTHDEIRQIFASTTAADWHHIPCWGHGSGPAYRETVEDGYSESLRTRSHGNVGVYRHDVLLSVATGMPITESNDIRHLDWAVDAFSEDALTFDFADVFYAGQLVDRVITVAVDGGRAILPVPRSGNEGQAPTTEPWRRNVARVAHELELPVGGPEGFDAYLERAGIVVSDG